MADLAPTSPSIFASEMHKDSSRGLGRINLEIATTREFYRFGVIQGKIINTNRVPSKAAGRKGTRRAWKRAHPPGRDFAGLLLAYFADALGLPAEAISADWENGHG